MLRIKPRPKRSSRLPMVARGMIWSLGVAPLLLLGARAMAARQVPLKTVDHVDLQRYLGRWYEIARLPNRFERKCDRDVTADYSMQGADIRVSNACIKADGSVAQSIGKAKVVDAVTNARLKVTFFWPFYGNYWILGLDPDYRWAVVGEPSRKYLWILSRTPTLSDAYWQRAQQVVHETGYTAAAIVRTKQTTL